MESISRNSVVREFKKYSLNTNEEKRKKRKEVHFEKIPDYQMPLDEEYTLDNDGHDAESDEGDGDDYIET